MKLTLEGKGSNMKAIKDFLWIVLHPSFWLMNYSYSAEWDKELRNLMKVHKFTNISRFTAYLGTQKVWIANYPFAAFMPMCLGTIHVRPSRIIIRDAYEKLINNILKEGVKDDR